MRETIVLYFRTIFCLFGHRENAEISEWKRDFLDYKSVLYYRKGLCMAEIYIPKFSSCIP